MSWSFVINRKKCSAARWHVPKIHDSIVLTDRFKSLVWIHVQNCNQRSMQISIHYLRHNRSWNLNRDNEFIWIFKQFHCFYIKKLSINIFERKKVPMSLKHLYEAGFLLVLLHVAVRSLAVCKRGGMKECVRCCVYALSYRFAVLLLYAHFSPYSHDFIAFVNLFALLIYGQYIFNAIHFLSHLSRCIFFTYFAAKYYVKC